MNSNQTSLATTKEIKQILKILSTEKGKSLQDFVHEIFINFIKKAGYYDRKKGKEKNSA